MRRRRVRNVVIAAGLAGVLIAAAVVGALSHQRHLSQPVRLRTAAVRMGTITQSLQMSGNLDPASATDANFLVGGQVTAVDATVGQQVAAGQTLATIDSTLLQNTLTVDQAKLTAAEAQLGADRATEGTPRPQLAEDQAQVTIDEVDVDQDRTAVREATLTAPVAGVVEQVNVAVGQQVAGGPSPSATAAPAGSAPSGSSSAGSGAEFVIIPAGGPIDVTGSVSDAAVAQVRAGQKAEVTAAGSSQAVAGTVTAIAPTATVSNSGVATFPVTVQIPGSPSAPRPGTSAAVQIVTAQATNVPVVPISALHTDGGLTTVDVLRQGRAFPLKVSVGISDATDAQILSGLTAGDVVVIAAVTTAGG